MLTKVSRAPQRGAVIAELSLVFVFLLSLFFGTVEITRAVWTYHSFSNSIKVATRYAAIRGAACGARASGCPSSVGEVIERIRLTGRELESARFAVTLEAGAQTVRCASLDDCAADPADWPVWPTDAMDRRVKIKGEYMFDTLFFSLWHGNPQTGFKLRTEATEVVEF